MCFKDNYLKNFLPQILARQERKRKAKVHRIMKTFYTPFKTLLCNRLLEALSICCFSLFFILLPFVMTSTIPLTLDKLSLFLVAHSMHLLLIFTVSTIAAVIFKLKGYEKSLDYYYLRRMSPKGLLHFPYYPLYIWRTSASSWKWMRSVKVLLLGCFFVGFGIFSVSLYMNLNSGYPSPDFLMIMLLVMIVSISSFFLMNTLSKIDSLYLILFVIFLSLYIVNCFDFFSIPTQSNTTTFSLEDKPTMTIYFNFLMYPYILFSLISLYGINSICNCAKLIKPLFAKLKSIFLRVLVILIGAAGIVGYIIFLRKFATDGKMSLFSYEVYWFVWVIWALLYVIWFWVFLKLKFKFGDNLDEYNYLLFDEPLLFSYSYI
eukprot:TRINITY_DN12007_c1_g1_i1.p1 TRINITY_DN12007_c1_g1~~TRINITY_DN12007_c1_g1_i1.p1  ORF type:complete len:436 (-),score=83.61 TRINITY_DN12007_c1_g1_i1:19-1143(-)